MQNKKRIYRHLAIIYNIYLATLGIAFATYFLPEFLRGWKESGNFGLTNRSYVVAAPLDEKTSAIRIEGLPENIDTRIEKISMNVNLPEQISTDTMFNVFADNGYAYILVMFMALSSLVMLVLFALIIISLRRSIRNEEPIRHVNISRTRWIGIIFLMNELASSLEQYIHIRKAEQLLAPSTMKVIEELPINYQNIILGILFIFMAEVFAIGSQLSEEQKLTI